MKLAAIGTLAFMLSGCGEDVQTDVAKCMMQGHKGSMLNTCMSASGYEFTWEKSSCGAGFDFVDSTGGCFEKRGVWRSAKLFFRKLTDKQN